MAISRYFLVNFCKQRKGNQQRIITHTYSAIILVAVAVEVCLIERLSLTFTANGKNKTFAVCLQLSVDSRIKILVFAVNSKRHFAIFV